MRVRTLLRALARLRCAPDAKPRPLHGKDLAALARGGYAPEKFLRVNDPVFVRETDLALRRQELEVANAEVPGYFGNLRTPFLLLAAMLLIFVLWRTCPYTALFRQLTLSEYTRRRGYHQTWFTYALGFRRWADAALYLPLFACIGANISRFLGARGAAALFLLNAALSANLALWAAGRSPAEAELMVPKLGGQNTVLFFGGVLLGLKPDAWLLAAFRSPLALVLGAVAVREYALLRWREDPEACRAAHLFSLGHGLLWGVALRRARIVKNVC